MKKFSLLVAAALLSPVAQAHQAGDILVRAGSATLTPDTSSASVLGSGKLEADTNTQLG
ncbi:hypothetical protein GCM10022394_35300 [Zobellella aerophila]|uniref:Outer membrane protein OmpW n=1 Tax=Zobellella aerophila TaxID=870480 RepID=A0ABP6WJ56_9GAMM